MQSNRKFYRFALLTGAVALAALVFSGCAGSGKKAGPVTVTETPGEMLTAPRWVTGGCETFWTDGAEDSKGAGRLCAVGVAAGMPTVTSLRTSAERRAHDEIARVLKPKIDAIIEKYAGSGNGHKDFGNPPDMERVRNLVEMITERAVLESETNSIWVAKGNLMHVLVSLDAAGFSRTVNNMTELSPEMRDELLKHAEKEFKALEKAEEKS
jgi:hypothetical protein